MRMAQGQELHFMPCCQQKELSQKPMLPIVNLAALQQPCRIALKKAWLQAVQPGAAS
jgi:hypothetical protein